VIAIIFERYWCAFVIILSVHFMSVAAVIEDGWWFLLDYGLFAYTVHCLIINEEKYKALTFIKALRHYRDVVPWRPRCYSCLTTTLRRFEMDDCTVCLFKSSCGVKARKVRPPAGWAHD
jgi:hypothetical protein